MYYHLTKPEYLDYIFRDGLIPQIGDNSSLVQEEEAAIYLCDWNSLPYWQILLDRTIALEVDIPDSLKEVRYSLYSEYLVSEPIPADRLKAIKVAAPTKWHMRELCLDSLGVLSALSVRFARFYDGQFDEDREGCEHDLQLTVPALLKTMQRYNYSVLTRQEIRSCLKELGEDGEYTFCDTYNNTSVRLYEQLLDYPKDKLLDVRQQLNDFIITKFSDCLDVNTGGWVGHNCNTMVMPTVTTINAFNT